MAMGAAQLSLVRTRGLGGTPSRSRLRANHERVLTPGDKLNTYIFPFVSLTSYGEKYAKGAAPHYYAADK